MFAQTFSGFTAARSRQRAKDGNVKGQAEDSCAKAEDPQQPRGMREEPSLSLLIYKFQYTGSTPVFRSREALDASTSS